MQRILVCAQDPVLAKKVRFLMERDECKVDILGSPSELEDHLEQVRPTLLVLSRELEGEDALIRVTRFDDARRPPRTLVLGGEPSEDSPDGAVVLPDPVDTTAIYREASRLLSLEEPIVDDVDPLSGEDEAIVLEHLEADDDEIISASEEMDEVLEALAESAHDELPDAFEAETSLGISLEEPKTSRETPPLEPAPEPLVSFEPEPAEVAPPSDAPAGAATLAPAAFARALHNAWSQSLSTTVVVERDGERLRIGFEKGRPVQVASDLPGDRLGRALVERGRIDGSQYAKAAIHAVENGIDLAAAVLELELLSGQDLDAELGTSAREQLVGCFGAREGHFWKEATAPAPGPRPYALEIGHVIARGLRAHADAQAIDDVLEGRSDGYFKLRRPTLELQQDFPLSQTDVEFLEYEGRAYNVEDAADGAGLPLSEAKRLLAILTVCEELKPFSPGAAEFEARIREERETRRVLESQVQPSGRAHSGVHHGGHAPAPGSWGAPSPQPNGGGWGQPAPAPTTPASDRSPVGGWRPPQDPAPTPDTYGRDPVPPPRSVEGSDAAPSTGTPLAAPPPLPSRPAPAHTEADVPPMPVPQNGEGVAPRPLAFAKPLPRGPDGSLLDVPERAISREHFQNGVSLLGKGNFANAEEHFRDAVALCSEEHVYLIGLARAIYYNPTYRGDGKVPVLRSIVERAKKLAPDDKRVLTLDAWVDHAERVHG